MLFDTGFGFGNAELDAYYQVKARRVADALDDAGFAIGDIDTVVNCHLHVDHARPERSIPGVPIYVQAAEWEIAHATVHTILEWIDFPGADYRHIDGDHDLAPGIQIVATPGHTPAISRSAVQTGAGLVVLTGQAVYTPGEWVADATAREGRSRAPDPAAYDRSVARLRATDPVEVRFAHDAGIWRR